MPYDEILIVCYRTTNPNVMVVAGASKTKCEKCQHEVWIAPSSRKVREKAKTRVVCEVCVRPDLPKSDIAIAKDGLKEIRDTLDNDKRRN